MIIAVVQFEMPPDLKQEPVTVGNLTGQAQTDDP